MSLGGLVGAVVLGVVGFFIGGPGGAFMGASIGFSLGMAIDPMTPDIKAPGMAVEPLQVTSNMIGTPIPDLLGTSKITGFLLAYGLERAEPQYTKVSGGKGGGGKKSNKELTGYKYYASWQLGICFGPADALYAVYKNDNDVIWEGELTRPVSGGVETVAIEDVGAMRFYFGTDDHPADATVAALIGDATLNSPLKGLCWAVFDDCCIGTYNRLPTISFVLRRTPTIAFSDKHQIQVCDYNPMHAIWYWLSVLGGLPETWLHSVDFAAVALALHGENRGITALLNQQQSLETYIETVNAHIDAILRYGCDGAFHPKLIRDDYDPDDLEVIDEIMLLDKPEFGRGSWIGTINEVKAQYSQITSWPIPLDSYLIGWYKFNEGGGVIVHNYASDGSLGGGPLPNLNVVNYDNNFWTYLTGFASSMLGPAASCNYAKTIINPARVFNPLIGFGIGIFFRYAGISPTGGCILHGSLVNSGEYDGFGFLYNSGFESPIAFYELNTEDFGELVKDEWGFLISSPTGIYLVRSDGTLTNVSWSIPLSSMSLGNLIVGAVLNYVETEGSWGPDGSYADLLIYNGTSPTIGDWAVWYDQLRSRYGMAARSGW